MQPRCGIYGIINATTGEVYIGKTQDLAKRRHDHFTALGNGKHYNRKLQESFLAHGPGAFCWAVFEECPFTHPAWNGDPNWLRAMRIADRDIDRWLCEKEARYLSLFPRVFNMAGAPQHVSIAYAYLDADEEE